VLSQANVGNHLHLHIKLGNRFAYVGFNRATTGAIALAVTERTRWSQIKKVEFSKESFHTASEVRKTESRTNREKLGFWDYRPFTRIIESLRAVLALRDYIRINQLEGFDFGRNEARAWIKVMKSEPG
jgi:hypothetical protein